MWKDGNPSKSTTNALLLFVIGVVLLLPTCTSTPVIFNFGDSNSDTGGLVAGLGFAINLPNGREFFRRSTGRLCDGRLIIDFLLESLNLSSPSPYLESLGPDFSHGVNFAVIGSCVLPRYRPFFLNIQILQFLRFKSRSLEASRGSTHLIDDVGFRQAIYMFDIGQNDLSRAFSARLSYAEVIKRIPTIVEEIRDSVNIIYENGGRNFWIYNTGPLGCLPQMLSLLNKDNRYLDQHGCLKYLNDAAKVFNSVLHTVCQEMRSVLKFATIVYVDIFSIKYDLVVNSHIYGFKKPLAACCGRGGTPYNYDSNVTCGQTGYSVCDEGSLYISWDGVHYTEAANKMVASKILSTRYSEPPIQLDYFLHS